MRGHTLVRFAICTTLSFSILSFVDSDENCLLSTRTSRQSYVVTVRKRIEPDRNSIICVGMIADSDKVVIPIKCLTQRQTDGYYTGTELKGLSGMEKGSCVQERNGLNYFTERSSDTEMGTLLRYVAILQVVPFSSQKNFEPFKALKRLLPDNEGNLRKYIEKITGKNVSCSVTCFEMGNKNNATRVPLLPIDKATCEQRLCSESTQTRGLVDPSCPEKLWSPDTYSCLSIQDDYRFKCGDYDMGSPITCENKICGMLKSTDSWQAIAIMQILTVEHLDALSLLVPYSATVYIRALNPLILLLMALLA